jgi:hypothetical protein
MAPWDRRQIFYTTAIYDLPFAKSATGLAGTLLKGWQFGGITNLASGGRVDVTVGADRANTGSRRVLLPNRIGNGNLSEGDRTLTRYFDTAAFALQPVLQYGNSGYAVIETDGTVNFDLVLSKRWAWSETREVQFRTEFFNAFNHPTFGNPGGAVDGGAAFGRVTSASQARQIQFGLKLLF